MVLPQPVIEGQQDVLPAPELVPISDRLLQLPDRDGRVLPQKCIEIIRKLPLVLVLVEMLDVRHALVADQVKERHKQVPACQRDCEGKGNPVSETEDGFPQ